MSLQQISSASCIDDSHLHSNQNKALIQRQKLRRPFVLR